ncbi:hypothetical protein CFC21_107102 [Triticum aestivum]|uniref:MATH domain-containing protein n=2 Tax=Triticum aestivum TaxID=4565 RepID=A0A3B6T8W7_WHEAT|nr:hypothetical protein CFC21_107102 [Triticum aestivum]
MSDPYRNGEAAATPDRMSLTTAATKDIFFDVEGYTAAILMSTGDNCYYPSERFTVGGYDWAVRFYPNQLGSHISILLVLLSEPKDGTVVGVRFGCAVLDRSGSPSAELWQSSSTVLSFYGEEWGFWRFAPRDVLEDPDYLEGDCLTLSCTVSVLRKPQLSSD